MIRSNKLHDLLLFIGIVFCCITVPIFGILLLIAFVLVKLVFNFIVDCHMKSPETENEKYLKELFNKDWSK